MDRKSESDTDTETDDFYAHDEIRELKNKVLKLESWKKEIGMNAVDESQKLRMKILELKDKEKIHEMEMLATKQENDTLKIQLIAFQEEHHKMDTERDHLLRELSEESHRNSLNKIEEENWAKSVEEQYHKIDKLTDKHRRSNSDLIQYQQRVSDLLEEKQAIGSHYNEMKQLNHQRIDSVNSLKERLKSTQNELADLKTKYEEQNAQHIIEKEKYHNLYNDAMIKLKEGIISQLQIHGSNEHEAISIDFNPQTVSQTASYSSVSPKAAAGVMEFEVIRRRSRSLDSDASNIHLHHMDLDEKDAYDMNAIEIMDEEQIRNEIREELMAKFEQDKKEWMRKEKMLQREYEAINRDKIEQERNESGATCFLLQWMSR